MSVLRAVLFDAGNTLLHLDYAFIAGVLEAAGHVRSPLDIRVAEYAAKLALDRHLAAERRSPEGPVAAGPPPYFGVVLHDLGIPPADIPPLLASLRAHNEADCLWRVLEPDTPAVLEELRERGFLLGVVSNADGRIEADVARRGLGGHFATIIDSHVVGVEKPARAIFELALARLDVAPGGAVYVGDVVGVDVCGARGAGLTAVLLDPLGRYPGTVDCPRIRGLAELLDLLPARAGG